MRSTLRRRSDIVAAVRYILIMYLILFLASYCLSSANNFLLQKKQIEAGRAGFTNEITFYAPLFNKDQIEELHQLLYEEKFSLYARTEEALISNQMLEMVTIQGDDGIYCCAVSQETSNTLGLHKGSFITIRCISIQISDLFDSAIKEKIVKVPYDTMAEIFPSYYKFQQVFIGSNEAVQIFRNYLDKTIGPFGEYEVNSIGQLDKETDLFIAEMVGSRMLVGAICSVIGLLNIGVIITSKTQYRKKDYGIRIALGATQKDIWILLMRNDAIKISLATVAVVISFRAVARMFGIELETAFDTSTVIGLAVTSISFLFLSALIVTKRIIRTKIADMITEDDL